MNALVLVFLLPEKNNFLGFEVMQFCWEIKKLMVLDFLFLTIQGSWDFILFYFFSIIIVNATLVREPRNFLSVGTRNRIQIPLGDDF